MVRLLRIMMMSVAVFLVALVIKEVLYQGDARKAEDLIQKIRLHGA